jgi:hypothetical protein
MLNEQNNAEGETTREVSGYKGVDCFEEAKVAVFQL